MIRLTHQAFDPGAELSAFCRGRLEVGAVASFTGLARAEQGRTETLELEAYPGFTEAAIDAIERGESPAPYESLLGDLAEGARETTGAYRKRWR